MNANIKIFLLCPIPEEQKPMNLYKECKENSMVNWITLPEKKYQSYLLSFFLSCFALSCLVRFAWLPSFAYLLEWTITNVLGSLTILILYLIILFFRWKQVEKGFISSKIFYEEGSWSDGQVWEKPPLIQKTDQCITTQKIQPLLQRIVNTLYFLSSLAFGCILVFELL